MSDERLTAIPLSLLVSRMKFAQDVHLDWARHQERLRRGGFPQAANVGGATGHRKWARTYDAVIQILEAKT